MGLRKSLVLGAGVTCLVLVGAWLGIQQRIDSYLPSEPDLSFLTSSAVSAKKNLQRVEAQYPGQSVPTVEYSPQIVYELNMSSQDAQELIRQELGSKRGWRFKEMGPGLWATNHILPEQVVVNVRRQGNVSTVTIAKTRTVGEFEAGVIRRIWSWQGNGPKTGT